MSKNSYSHLKSKKLTVPEIIDYCKTNLGLTFNLISEEDAKSFLQKHNYFFRLKQYAETCNERTKSGKYIGLDFGHLVELSTVDMFFRKLILKMTIDLEHYLKVKLVNECQNNPADDGYEVVDKFLESHEKIKATLTSGARLAGYSGLDFDKYIEVPTVWNFVEMIGFYDFINFYIFYYDFFRIKCDYAKHFDSVRRLRNAAAHNICMLCSFKSVQSFKYDLDTSFELLRGNIGIGNGVISSCMKVPLLNDFAVMLSVYTKLITSPKIKEFTLKEISEFFDGRMIHRKQYFESNTEIKNAYRFARKVLEYYSGGEAENL
ncbi:Abi family protein [Treponema sp. Marseille-Q4132]|uniref:Abi family protein n=1 Tax=Treponema sp. Marseille-Q4132 TaxID=2766701 RepID=UPI001653157B|nr:Abi family protein [Treponema sp. Marseille-Q4132]QNL96543.1 Abi family protein [Treponema sp. Marseille-Q4132]